MVYHNLVRRAILLHRRRTAGGCVPGLRGGLVNVSSDTPQSSTSVDARNYAEIRSDDNAQSNVKSFVDSND